MQSVMAGWMYSQKYCWYSHIKPVSGATEPHGNAIECKHPCSSFVVLLFCALSEKSRKPSCKHQHSKTSATWKSSTLPSPGAKAHRGEILKVTAIQTSFILFLHTGLAALLSNPASSTDSAPSTACSPAAPQHLRVPHFLLIAAFCRAHSGQEGLTCTEHDPAGTKQNVKQLTVLQISPGPPAYQGGHRPVIPWAVLLPGNRAFPQCHKQYLIWASFILSLFAIFNLNLF